MKRNYFSRLLRIWQTGKQEKPEFWASLEDPHTHQILTFHSLESLHQYLRQTALRPAENQSNPCDDHPDTPPANTR